MIKKNETSTDIKKLKSEISELRKNLLNLRFQKFSGQLEKTDKIRKTKKNIAKLKHRISNQIGANNA